MPATTSRTRQQMEALQEELRKLKMEKSVHKKQADYLAGKAQVDSEKIRTEIRQIKIRGQTLDLAFLVDITGSMQTWINMVHKELPAIVRGIAASYPSLKLRVAFVGYRDYNEQLEVLGFEGFSPASGSQRFSDFATALMAHGGGDDAEDVFSGLEAAAALEWKSANRILVHIADAPCHGREFHDASKRIGDRYPEGDRDGRSLSTILTKLRLAAQIDTWLFCHLNTSTHKMISRFQETAGPQAGDWISSLREADLSSIPDRVVAVSKATIMASMRRGGKTRHIVRAVVPGTPDWSKITPVAADVYITVLGPLQEVLAAISDNRPIEIAKTESISIKIATSPFTSEGGCRWPMYARTEKPQPAHSHPGNVSFVVKRFKDVAPSEGRQVNPAETHHRRRYEDQMEVQAVSASLAAAFNRVCRSLAEAVKDINFCQVSMLVVNEGTRKVIYNMERELKGEWVKHTNNMDFANKVNYAATVHAFQHWTYVHTGGLLLVADTQGVTQLQSSGEEHFWLSDPAIHCEKHLTRFGNTNLGKAGYDGFFKVHECNHICRKLGLDKYGSDCRHTDRGTRL